MNSYPRDGLKWSRDETIVALGLYFQVPFGQITSRNRRIIELAQTLGRSPASLAMKMCNIGRLDPTLTSRGVVGLQNGSKMEVEVWRDYSDRPEFLSEEFNRLVRYANGSVPIEDDTTIKTPAGLDGKTLTKYRINQTFFRTSVLSAYGGQCCITAISDERLLVASHIKPWAKCIDGNERTDLQNGLCLNALHDRAFDKGLFTLDEHYRIVLSPLLKESKEESWFIPHFGQFEGRAIRMPDKRKPAAAFLEYHRQNIFVT